MWGLGYEIVNLCCACVVVFCAGWFGQGRGRYTFSLECGVWGLLGVLWSCAACFGFFGLWSGLVCSGLVWSCVVLCGLVLSGVDCCSGLVWSCLVLCGLVWSDVVWCGLVWSGVGLCGVDWPGLVFRCRVVALIHI